VTGRRASVGVSVSAVWNLRREDSSGLVGGAGVERDAVDPGLFGQPTKFDGGRDGLIGEVPDEQVGGLVFVIVGGQSVNALDLDFVPVTRASSL